VRIGAHGLDSCGIEVEFTKSSYSLRTAPAQGLFCRTCASLGLASTDDGCDSQAEVRDL
jgi:hypothetical protein